MLRPLEHACLCKAAKKQKQKRRCVCVQAKAMLNAVNALPHLEQADKLIARMPPAKWATDMQTAASEFCKLPLHTPLPLLYASCSLPNLPFPFPPSSCASTSPHQPPFSCLELTASPLGIVPRCLSLTALPPQPPPQHPFLPPPPYVTCL